MFFEDNVQVSWKLDVGSRLFSFPSSFSLAVFPFLPSVRVQREEGEASASFIFSSSFVFW